MTQCVSTSGCFNKNALVYGHFAATFVNQTQWWTQFQNTNIQHRAHTLPNLEYQTIKSPCFPVANNWSCYPAIQLPDLQSLWVWRRCRSGVTTSTLHLIRLWHLAARPLALHLEFANNTKHHASCSTGGSAIGIKSYHKDTTFNHHQILLNQIIQRFKNVWYETCTWGRTRSRENAEKNTTNL